MSEIDAAVSLYEHVHRRKAELANQVTSITTIYLDTNFWAWLERAARGEASKPAHGALLASLRKGVAEGILVCPTTETTLLELVLRHPPDRQDEPLFLIDQLSQLTSILPQKDRMELEIEQLLSPNADGTPLVWVGSSYLFGETHPVPNPDFFDAATRLDIQKRFFDHRWDSPVSTFLKANAIQHDERPDLIALAARFDQENKNHSADGKSFADFLSIERRGISHILAELAEPVASRLRPNETYDTNLWANLFYRALNRPSGRKKLRTANILASLHAIRRANSAQRVHPNDLHDFEHATAAVGYCDAFFCEASLAEGVRSAGLLNAGAYDCFVTSRTEDALTFVETVSNASP